MHSLNIESPFLVGRLARVTSSTDQQEFSWRRQHPSPLLYNPMNNNAVQSAPALQHLEWRNRLHHPTTVHALRQPRFTDALHAASNVIVPCLARPDVQSASVVLFGPSGSGKSLLTRLLVKELHTRLSVGADLSDGAHHDAHPFVGAGSPPSRIVVVEMSGLLHGTPARAWKHVADTLAQHEQCSDAHTSAKLSSQRNRDTVDDGDDATLADIEGMQDVVQIALQRLKNDNGALLLVIDQLHRFTTADHLSQTVLYSLLNLLQDRSLRAACVAHTSYIDISDLLEKRVLSRLSHRKVVLPLVESVDQVTDFLRMTLQNCENDNTGAVGAVTPTGRRGRARSGTPGRRKSGYGGRRLSRRSTGGRISNSSEDLFEGVVRELLVHDVFQRTVGEYLSRHRVLPPLLRAVDAALSLTVAGEQHSPSLPQVPSTDSGGLVSSLVHRAVTVVQEALATRDAISDCVASLTVLQVALLVALQRIDARQRTHDGHGVDASGTSVGRVVFRDVYEEYCKLGRMDGGRLAERDAAAVGLADIRVAERAWEALVECGLVVRTGGGAREGRTVFCTVGAAQVETAVNRHPGCSDVLRNWAKRRTLAI